MEEMQSTTVIVALLIAVCHGDICGVYDGEGNALGEDTHGMGYISRDAEPGSALPGELRFENMELASVEVADCSVGKDMVGNVLKFTVKEPFNRGNVCTIKLIVRGGNGCPVTSPKEYKIRYYLYGFVQDSYIFQATFPMAKGGKHGGAGIEASIFDFPTGVEFEEDFEGLEIVQVRSTYDEITRFEVRVTKLLYLLDEVNLTMIATNGALTSKTLITICVTRDPDVPLPASEGRFHVVRFNSSDLNSNIDAYRGGMITLKQDRGRVSFDHQSVSGNDLKLELEHICNITGVRLPPARSKNSSSQDVVLQLIARLSNQFSHENEGFTTLLIWLEGMPEEDQTPILCDMNNKEDLKTAVIVLSIVIVVLILLIIFLYFKYVCVKKPEPAPPCKKCSVPVAVKTRRPTPRKISEYPYTLDVMPPQLETLAETEVEEEGGERLEIKVIKPKDDIPVVPSTSGVKTRKRSMTFRESDEESRQYRERAEVAVHQTERKVSNESQRRLSAEEERRRRKSSVKMYRCLT